MSPPTNETAGVCETPAVTKTIQKSHAEYNKINPCDKAKNAPLSENHRVALEYARAGISIFPCNPTLNLEKQEKGFITPKKNPILVKSWSQEATADEMTIDKWWRNNPDALIGLPCKPHNLLVIDADKHGDGVDGVSALQSLIDQQGGLPPNTVVVETQSGGKHYYFRQPEGVSLGNGEGRLPRGINVRGIGQGDGRLCNRTQNQLARS
jgi:hypothetical protein